MYLETINQMDKDELKDLLLHYQELADKAHELLYYRGELIDILQRLNQNLSLEHLADRNYRDERRVVDEVETELTAKYRKQIEENTAKPYVGKRRETGCIDDFLVNEKEIELIDKACKPMKDLKITLNKDPVETTLTEAIPKL